MPKKVVQRIVDEKELDVLTAPRDDFLVKETVVSDTFDGPRLLCFALSEGAFTRYQRTLEITEAAPQVEVNQPATAQAYQVTETTSFSLSVPFWSPALNLLVKRDLAQPRSATSPRHPWWLPAQRLNARSGHVIGVLCVMSLFTGYLGTLLSQTLTYVSDFFGADKGTQGIVLSLVRIGALLSLTAALLADRWGRKFLLRLALPGAFLFTALGAAALGIWTFAAAQTLARGLTTAVALLIGIVAAEEMPAGARAYAASVLSLSAALGAGVMVMLLPLADSGEQAWRILFLIPVLALPALVWLLQKLPETWRFEHARKSLAQNELKAESRPAAQNQPETPNQTTEQTQPETPNQPDPEPASRQPRKPAPPEWQRLLLLGSALFFFLLFVTPASQFLNEFLREERGFSGVKIAAFQLFSNTPAGISLYLAGRWSDIRGRRQIAILALLGMTAFTVLRYASDGWELWGWSLGSSIFASAVVPTLGVYGPELFNTTRRARSNGTLTVIGVCGSALGVLAVGHFTEHWVSFGTTFAILSFAPLVVVLLVLFAFPETARQELETLNPSDLTAAQPTDPAPGTTTPENPAAANTTDTTTPDISNL